MCNAVNSGHGNRQLEPYVGSNNPKPEKEVISQLSIEGCHDVLGTAGVHEE